MTSEHILSVLSAYEPLEVPTGNARPAAVLVPLRDTDDGLEVVLTRRAEHVHDPHSGQVSFPGGRVEEDDDNREQTALREAQEELGIPPDSVRVIGRLDDMVTVTGFHVSPVVGRIEGEVSFSPSADEVARVFTVRLDDLLREEGWEHRVHAWRGSEVRIWHFAAQGEDVWGATARILRDMVEILRRASPETLERRSG